MRSLTQNEVTQVAGAGLFTNIFGSLGTTIGGAIDSSFITNNGINPAISAVTPANQLGQGIGMIIDSVFNPFLIPTAVNTMITAISNIVTVSKANNALLKQAGLA